ncbi:MAG: cyclic nucleotide-binding domain-containing protein, partial [Pseudomonadota bacterium]
MSLPAHLRQFLASVHPYDSLSDADVDALAEVCKVQDYTPGETVFAVGDTATSLYIIARGEVDVTDETGVQISILGPRNSFGERALLRGEDASRTAVTTEDTTLIV